MTVKAAAGPAGSICSQWRDRVEEIDQEIGRLLRVHAAVTDQLVEAAAAEEPDADLLGRLKAQLRGIEGGLKALRDDRASLQEEISLNCH